MKVLMRVFIAVMLLSFITLLIRVEHSDSIAFSSEFISIGLSASNGSIKLKILFDDLKMNGLYTSKNQGVEQSDIFAFRTGVETDFVSDMYYFELGVIHFGVLALFIFALWWVWSAANRRSGNGGPGARSTR